MKIKLLSAIMIAGQRRKPDEVVEVSKALATDLIYRKKAVEITENIVTDAAKFEVDEPEKLPKISTNPYQELNYQELMQLIKDRDLSDKLRELPNKKKPDLIALLIAQDNEGPDVDPDDNSDDINLNLEELKLMAKELELKYAEDISAEELQILIENKLDTDGND